MSVNSAFALLAITGTVAMRIILQRTNRRLESGTAAVSSVMKGEAAAAISGITEEERIARKEGFRYIT